MPAKAAARRVLARAVQQRNTMEKARTLVVDLSPARISLEEAATVAFHARNIRSRYNKKRDLLMLEFDTPQAKLAYMKRLPQWLWNQHCVVWEYAPAELELWRMESLG